MKILHISALPVWPLQGKGGMPSLRETLCGHVRGGHEVLLVLPQYNIIGDHANFVTVRDDEGYNVILMPCRWAPALAMVRRFARRLGGGKELPYLLRWLLNLTLCLFLTLSLTLTALRLRFVEKRHFDLVYAHNQYASLAGWMLGKLFSAPNVTRLYGTFLADLIKKPLVWLRYPVASAGYLVPHSLLICANDGTRGDEVADKLNIDMSKFRFWQNGVDLPTQPPNTTRSDIVKSFGSIGLREECTWIITCSRLSYWKRIDRMLHALKSVCEKGCDCQLLVAGDGPERERLTKLSIELGVAENVIWLGAVQHDQIWELMNVADVFMITNDVTNRCNPLYEAMSAALPIVSVSDPSTADLLNHGDNALLADKEDFKTLADNLYLVCQDTSLASNLRLAQQSYSESFRSWTERMETEVIELERLVMDS